jgi:hypothetical protein
VRGARNEEMEPKDGSTGDSNRKPICKFYKKRTGDCKFGAACKFYHPSESPDGTAPSAAPLQVIPTAAFCMKNEDFMGSAEGGDREQASPRHAGGGDRQGASTMGVGAAPT